MIFNLKKEIQFATDHFKKQLEKNQEELASSKKNNPSNIEYLDGQVKNCKEILRSKCFVKAFKILSSGSREKILQYLENDFTKLPEDAQKYIFHRTTSLTADGKSIYDGSKVNVFSMYRDIEASYDGEYSIRNLFEAKYTPKYVDDLFPIFLRMREREYEFNPDKMFDDLISLSNITFKPEISPDTTLMYINKNTLGRLIRGYINKTYCNRYAGFDGDVTTNQLAEFYDKLENAVSKSPNLQNSGILNEPNNYAPFLTGKYAFDNFLELLKHPQIKKNIYAADRALILNGVLTSLEGMPEQERLSHIIEYVSDPLFVPTSEQSNFILNNMRRFNDKSLFLDFDKTMPLFEKLSFATIPLAHCFASSHALPRMEFSLELRQVEDKTFGIDRLNLPQNFQSVKVDRETIKQKLVDYYNNGLITDDVYSDVLKIAQRYNKNMTEEKLKQTISQNHNLKSIMEYLSALSQKPFRTEYESNYPPECLSPYSRGLYDFETLFPKTRLQSLPDLEVFKKMSLEQKQKFNVKVWNQFASLPIFSEDDNTKKALVEFIAVMGLFEDDANVEKRRQVAYKLATNIDQRFSVVWDKRILTKIQDAFYGKGNLPTELEGKEGLTEEDINEFLINKYFKPCKIRKFVIRDDVEIPEELQGYFGKLNTVSENDMAELKKLTGSFGKKMNNFLSPYAKDGDVYRLKKDAVIPPELVGILQKEISQKEYEEFLSLAQVPAALSVEPRISKIAAFLNPVREVYVDGIVPRDDLSNNEKESILNIILSSTHIDNRLNFASVHRMFDGCKQTYNQEFYEFLVKNFGMLLDYPERHGLVKDIQRTLGSAKTYYKARGNSEPNFWDLLTYLENATFNYGFGLDEFAQEVKNSGVRTQEAYEFYESLLPELKGRKKTTIPRHEKTYVYTDKNGKKYTILTKILRLDDPATMLVGESKFTNCCQVYRNAGEKCMKHAATSQNGGIFATYLIDENGIPEMLTQSWIWSLESKLCLDNVEATTLITGKHGDEKRLYQDIATFGIVEASKDLLKSSREGVEKYIAEQTAQVNMSPTLTQEEKEKKLSALEELRQRQTLKIVTVGEGCDDLNVAETFKRREEVELSQGPKGYQGYRDSGFYIDGDATTSGISVKAISKQHIIIKTPEEILPVDENYEDVAIFRDDRRISLKKGDKIPHSLLKHITEIEASAHKQQMVNYTENGKPILYTVEQLAQIYGCRASDLTILAGEDWYYVYSDNGRDIEVYDFAKTTPRIEDENKNQQEEMNLAFNTILLQSIEVKDGKLVGLKGIKADLREDTSYLLYLYQKHRGIIEQVGEDLRYKFNEDENKTPVSAKEQEKTMRDMRKIRESGNGQMYMHQVKFLPTEKTIQKAIDHSFAKFDERSVEC